LSYGSVEGWTTRSTLNSRPRRTKEIQGGESEGRGILAGARTAFEVPLQKDWEAELASASLKGRA